MRKLSVFFVLIYHLLAYPVAAYSNVSALNLSKEEQQWLNANPEASVALDGYFPPYSFLNDAGELEGVAVDVLALISQRTGLKFNTHPKHEWKSLYKSAQEKKVDIVATMVNRPVRHQWFNFSQPYIYKSLVILPKMIMTILVDVMILRVKPLPWLKIINMFRQYLMNTQQLNHSMSTRY